MNLRRHTAPPFGRLALLALLLIAPLGTGCQTARRVLRGTEYPDKVPLEEVPSAIARAEQAFDAGDTKNAVGWARAASRAEGLPTVERNEVQTFLEQAASVRIEELSGDNANPKELVDLYELELPRQLAVSAAVRAAHQYVDRGKRVKAFKLLQKVDTRYPLHHERYAAASLLVEIGLELADDKSKFLWFFNRRNDGIAVLEYVVLNAPWEPRCDEAYFKLGQLYEEDLEWQLAIERHENLVLYHPDSRLRPYSQGLIPHLRLMSIDSPEYDRNELVDARAELEAWLLKYGESVDEELERQVRIDLTDCLRRLADSDIGIARFYRRVDNDYGQNLHAERALQEAELAGDTERMERARALMIARVESGTSAPEAPADEPPEGPLPPSGTTIEGGAP